ncbi:MobP2 family relaxase [Clostridium faecium]|uniref:Relaxase n=1 Tax=Clostridium faecium TaxID=2762223 RepID=A0ABR8YNI4_9CLOT|nr:MobP2 family relaxase [Clostridium faecium]MBD8045805.1 hypothetical protein [Clostridium faecium]
MSVGVIHKVKFVSSKNKKFSNYISYIDRDEATRNYRFEEFSLYNDYMGNPQKSGSLFTCRKDSLNKEEAEELKKLFSKAQKNKSLMWQDVFSFDNEWLEKQGIYDKKTHTVDEERIRSAVRNSMNELMKRENLNELIWSASLHYNTDNIHVHIASVELQPSRERGKRKPKTLINMKSKFVNNLIDRQAEYNQINEIIRTNIIESKKNFHFSKDKEMKRLVQEVIKKLPEDKSQWRYNYNSLHEVRPILDEITKYYIDNYKKEDYKELIKKLDKEELILKETYGEGESFRYKDYKKNKINDLYTRMGNSVLTEIRDYVKAQEQLIRLEKIKSYNSSSNLGGLNIVITSKDINRIKNSMGNDLENMKNQRAYERIQFEIENEIS